MGMPQTWAECLVMDLALQFKMQLMARSKGNSSLTTLTVRERRLTFTSVPSRMPKCHGPEGAGVICIPEGNRDIKCPGNWDMAGTGCYHISPEAMSWPKAKWYCERRHGFLAEIKNKKQHDDLLQDFVATAEIGASGVWIGLNDRATEEVFRWANSGEHLQFANWNSNEPANTETDDCVFMTADHKWHNRPCPELKPALCQRRYIFA